MTPDLLWQRYARIWSSEPARRAAELEACLADGCSYCDVNGLIEGREALSNYMGGFQQSVKGGKFEICSVKHHHDRMLAEWNLIGGDGAVLQSERVLRPCQPTADCRASPVSSMPETRTPPEADL